VAGLAGAGGRAEGGPEPVGVVGLGGHGQLGHLFLHRLGTGVELGAFRPDLGQRRTLVGVRGAFHEAGERQVGHDTNGPEDRLCLANARASVPWQPVIEKILTHLGL
jgi:hypothetical protein